MLVFAYKPYVALFHASDFASACSGHFFVCRSEIQLVGAIECRSVVCAAGIEIFGIVYFISCTAFLFETHAGAYQSVGREFVVRLPRKIFFKSLDGQIVLGIGRQTLAHPEIER